MKQTGPCGGRLRRNSMGSMSREDPEEKRTARTRPVGLSRRLMAIADLARSGECVCDVGCDHAHIPIRLLQVGRFKRAIGMDVIEGPLEKAAGNLSLYGMQDRIGLRLSDGLDAFCIGEADTLVITGMGGSMMQEILLREPEKTRSFQALVLGPQSDPEKVRSALRTLGFRIEDERLIYDDGKYYPIVRAVRGDPKGGHLEDLKRDPLEDPFGDSAGGDSGPFPDKSALLQETEDLFGPVLLERRDPVLLEFLVRQERVLKKIHSSVRRAAQTNGARSEDHLAKAEEIGHRIILFRTALKMYGRGTSDGR
ncbi:MAG: SAM-dependent methyltransferase [Sarcina sp.]|nr:SAM-dependent methyltransferase [Sarcina sp.]